ncbi:MAG: phosphate acyltransferase PlsX [Bacteroidales bacterium]|nr:phosphate acyltransferase PlsX [Bacteroidales bacterium]
MKIGLDTNGGDFAPNVNIDGAILALDHIGTDKRIVLIGDANIIEKELKAKNIAVSNFDVVHAPQNIEMCDNPVKAFESKTESSMVKGFKMLAQSQIDCFASIGNTGAMLVGAMHIIKPAEGIIRPCISSVYPNIQGKNNLMLDVGLNSDCKPEMLKQFAIMGSVYANLMHGIEQPKLGLLNIGTEKGKGNQHTKAAYTLLQECEQVNFVGNVEPNQIFNADIVDVIVTDGFVGNIVLKQAEAFYGLLKNRNIKDEYFEKYNFEIYGGTPVLGLNKCVFVGHGCSNSTAVKNMILQSAKIVKVNVCEEIIKIMRYEKN